MWVLFRRFKVREHERGLLFRDREFKGVLRPGRHLVWDPLLQGRAWTSCRCVTSWLDHKDLDVIAKSGALGDEARVVDLKDHERAVVWVDGRVRGRPEAGPVRAVDGLPRRAGRGRSTRARCASSTPTWP